MIGSGRFDKVEDRVALHELLRIGVQRGEDLTMLHGLEQHSLHAAKLKLVSDCKIREEIRQKREEAVLKRLTYANPLSEPPRSASATTTTDIGGLSRTSSSLSSTAGATPSLHISETERQKALAQIQSEMRRLAPPSALPPSRPGTSQGQRPPSSRGKLLTPTMMKSSLALGPSQNHTSSPYSSRPSSSASASRPSSSSAFSRSSSPYGVKLGGEGGDRKGQRSLSLPPPSATATSSGMDEGSQGNEGSRFQQLLKLHEILIRNLEEHKSSGGHLAASAALAKNVKHARAIFNEFLAEIDSVVTSTSPLDSKQKPLSNQGPLLSWTFRLLQLGQLGLTSTDLHRLSLIRSSLAARSIQKQVRIWLRLLRQKRIEEIAEKKDEEMRSMLIASSAVVIQSAWRGLVVRRELERRRLERRIERVYDFKLKLQAIKIQRAFRRWRRRQRVQAALLKHLGPDVDFSRKYATPSLHEVKAATKIQAAVRGWSMRRSSDLWWSRRLKETRANRQLGAMWRDHRARMISSLPLLNDLVGTIVAEAEASDAAVLSVERERMEFEARWDDWVSGQLSSAMNEPLPKGWLPINDAQGVKFLNTKTRELHLFHPSVNVLRPHVVQQREAAERRIKEREAKVMDYLDRVKSESSSRQQQVLKKLMDV